MKILHAAVAKNPSSGIVKQMTWESRAAKAAQISWTVRIFTPDGVVSEDITRSAATEEPHQPKRSLHTIISDWLQLYRGHYRWLLSAQSQFDVIILRYSSCNPYQLLFIKHAKVPVYIVHHTKEIPELARSGRRLGRVRAIVEFILTALFRRYVHSTIAVTDEILAYERRRYKIKSLGHVYPNGAEYDSSSILDDKRSGSPTLIFVASTFSPWHGLDLLLQDIAKSNADFSLEIVGNATKEHRTLAANDTRITFHGSLSFESIRNLAEGADVGLSSFALYRKHMGEACTLKVREYLMMGLPVYAGYREVLPDDFPYYHAGQCEIESILQYAHRMRTVSRAQISETARPHIEKKILLERLYRWICENTTSTTSHEIA